MNLESPTSRRKRNQVSGVVVSGRSYQQRSDTGGPAPDHILAPSVAHEEMAAIGDLYECHRQYVYRLCLRMTRNSEQAEDLTQEVFIHLVHKIGLFRGESRFTTWLHRLTVNLVLMHFRRLARRKRERVIENIENYPALLRNRQSESARVIDRIALDSALGQLPPGCRSVFLLFDVEGWRHDEIAHQLGCTVGTSKSQLHKARKKLRHLLITSEKEVQPIADGPKKNIFAPPTPLTSPPLFKTGAHYT